MRETHPSSVRTSVRSTLLVLLLSLAIVACLGHESLRRSDARTARVERAASFATSLSHALSTGAFPAGRDLRELGERLCDHPEVLAIGVWPRSGQALVRTGVDEAVLQLLPQARASDTWKTRVRPVVAHREGQEDRASACIVTTPIEGMTGATEVATLSLVLRDRTAVGTAAAHHRWFYLPVGLVTASVFVWGWRRLRRDLVLPIGGLVALAESEPCSDQVADRFRRHREFEVLAGALGRLQRDLHSTKHRAHVIERRVDSQVAKETQRIARDLKRVQWESRLDPLTGVHNRRFLEQEFPEIFEAQRASRQDLCVAMLDLDHFKRLNDTLGHAAGDDILRFLGQLLRESLRNNDFAARYGGDEFVLVFPGVSAEQSLTLIQRVLAMFTQRVRMMVPPPLAISISAGVASLIHHRPGCSGELIALADEGLLIAKQSGKQRAQICTTRRFSRRPRRTERKAGALRRSCSNL